MTTRVVVDANVLISANQRGTHVDLSCAASSAVELRRIEQEGVLLEDTIGLVYSEYKRYCNFSGQPGPGDRFFLWYLRTRWSDNKVKRIEIGKDETEIAQQVPTELRDFDPSDLKWLAVYVAGKGEALLNAADSDYAERADDLQRNGIRVVELRGA